MFFVGKPSRHRRRALLGRAWWSRGSLQVGSDPSTIAPTLLNANANPSCATGVWTTCLESQVAGTPVPLIMVNRFDVYPYVAGVLSCLPLAGTLTACLLSYALVAGTPLETVALDFNALNAAFTATAPVYVPFIITGALGSGVYAPPGMNPLIQLMPTGDTVTVAHLFSYGIFQLLQGVE
jgi:hypothetical protein